MTACTLCCRSELANFEQTVNMHAGVPKAVEDVVNAMPHDAHPMAVILTGKHHNYTHAFVMLTHAFAIVGISCIDMVVAVAAGSTPLLCYGPVRPGLRYATVCHADATC